jgi:glycosyltransferase involved in cell wall biosynthesis
VTRLDVPALLLTGPPRHGVARYARDVAEHVRRAVPGAAVVEVPVAADLPAAAAAHPRAHLHVTDRLLADGPEAAAELVERVAGATRLTVTLHDVPQPSDGPRNLPRRTAAYARVAAAAAAVAVNSEHEALLLAEHGVLPAGRAARVLPLGTAAPDTAGDRPEVAPDGHDALPAPDALPGDDRPPAPGSLLALVAGFVYPGKGHDDVAKALGTAAARLRAAGATVPEVAVVAVGGPAPGHEGDVMTLRAEAAAHGVELRVTGSLDDAAFRRALRAGGIPVAAHQHLSASRTLLDWGEAGRRPLAVDSRYAREMAALRPGTLALYPPAELDRHLERAWREPASTVLPAGTTLAPTLSDVARGYLAWWAEGPR